MPEQKIGNIISWIAVGLCVLIMILCFAALITYATFGNGIGFLTAIIGLVESVVLAFFIFGSRFSPIYVYLEKMWVMGKYPIPKPRQIWVAGLIFVLPWAITFMVGSVVYVGGPSQPTKVWIVNGKTTITEDILFGFPLIDDIKVLDASRENATQVPLHAKAKTKDGHPLTASITFKITLQLEEKAVLDLAQKHNSVDGMVQNRIEDMILDAFQRAVRERNVDELHDVLSLEAEVEDNLKVRIASSLGMQSTGSVEIRSLDSFFIANQI